jgi:uncharacterized membrane protein
MNVVMIVLRVIHIGLGAFWAGAMLFVVMFLEPSVREAGPDGAKVMQGIMRRRYLNWMPVFAGLTILSGLALLHRASVGFNGLWIASPIGMGYTSGGVAAIVAFIIGVFVMRRSVLKAAGLNATLQKNPDDPNRDATMAEIQALQHRARIAGRWVAGLLTVAVVTMAVARYL